MKTPLEDDIERLTLFDDWRVKAARMRDAGREVLADSYKDENRPFWEPPPEARFDPDPRLGARTEILEYAAVLRAVLAHHRTNWIEPPQFLIDRLESVEAAEVMDPGPDEVPVLRAAKAMCALAVTPNSAFSSSVMIFYYYIVRALYVVDAPEWSTGGARAGDATPPSAYVTWQCIRAIAGFRRALLNTAMLFGNVAAIIEQREERFSASIPEAWRRIDAERGSLELFTSIKTVRDNIALTLAAPEILAGSVTDADLDEQSATIIEELINELTRRRDGFARARLQIHLRRGAWVKLMEDRQDTLQIRRNIRLETAHGIALQAVQNAVTRADAAIAMLTGGDPSEKKLRALQKQFEEAARYTQKVMAPATTYVSHVLDRELAAASSTSEFWDPTELAFAAVAYGEARQRWDDERLARAARHLGTRISARGVFPLGQAIHTSDRGYQLHPLNTDVIRAFAGVLRNVQSVELDPEVVRCMLSYLQDTQEKPGFWRVTPRLGWRQRTTTASAVLALDAINEMLDERINGIVLGHFSVRSPDDLKVSLSDAFYPDYGLVGAPDPIGRADSVAVVLERMRAHVLGVELPSYGPLFSLVLFGPPGTGKTTLVEALARSCKVSLVEVTPSDIVIGGADAIERRTRAVFKALSLLTRAVILFDEFDPVLLERKVEEKNPSVFSFLTPGMLPKLKTLHDQAEKRGVAYVLITNLIAKLDPAAIRNGRFDARLGIYPPDFLSRAGRIWSAIARYKREQEQKKKPTPPDPSPDDVWTVVRDTRGGPMTHRTPRLVHRAEEDLRGGIEHLLVPLRRSAAAAGRGRGYARSHRLAPRRQARIPGVDVGGPVGRLRRIGEQRGEWSGKGPGERDGRRSVQRGAAEAEDASDVITPSRTRNRPACC